MRPLSAAEAVSPAIERARDVLGRPFRWGTFLKIAAVAFFAEIGGGLNFNVPGRSSNVHGLPPALIAFVLAFSILFAIVALVIGLVMLYIGSRLQLVLVELVATRQIYISPLWRKCGPPTWRWIGLKLLFFLLVILLTALIGGPVVLYLVLHGHRFGAFVGVFSGLHIVSIILLIAFAFVVFIVIGAAYTLLRDFALPSIAFENLGIPETLGRVRALLAAEPGQVALFLLLRMALVFVFAIAAEIAIVFVALFSLIPLGLAGGVLWLFLHRAGAGGTIVLIALGVFGGLIFVCWMVCVAIAILGSVYTFSQAYALYFLGGRYPLLGDMLDRSTPPGYAYARGFPQPTYPPPQPGAPSIPPGY